APTSTTQTGPPALTRPRPHPAGPPARSRWPPGARQPGLKNVASRSNIAAVTILGASHSANAPHMGLSGLLRAMQFQARRWPSHISQVR
ncbi:MAG: hypothetical protein KKA73_24495, partial [Chloroflexi bacterium]|nr:hypothetical protein [Chloroflexota bacterium]